MALLSSLFAVFAGIILPFGAAIFLSMKKKGYLKPVLLGAATFFVFQILLRLPGLALLGKTLWFSVFATTQPLLYALFLGGTAALFEEGGRYIVMRLFMKNNHRLHDGITFGIGHGGIEAVYILGIGAVILLFSQTQVAEPLDVFAGGFERLCTIVIHIAFSVMVLKSVALNKPLWLVLAFVLHTVIDMAAVLLARAGFPILALEAVVFVIALALLAYVLAEYRFERKKKKGEVSNETSV